MSRPGPAEPDTRRSDAYLSELGRVEATTWFAFEIAAIPGKVQKLAAEIESLAQQEKGVSDLVHE